MISEEIPIYFVASRAKGVERAPIAWAMGFLSVCWFVGAMLGSVMLTDVTECDKSPGALMIFISLLMCLFLLFSVMAPNTFTWFLLILCTLLTVIVLGVFSKTASIVRDKTRRIFTVFVIWYVFLVIATLLIMGYLMYAYYVKKQKRPLQPSTHRQLEETLQSMVDKEASELREELK